MYGIYEKMTLMKKILCGLVLQKAVSVVGLGPLLPSAFSVLKIKMGQKKWRVSRLIIKSEDLISFKSILWETATHPCQLCLLLESIIFLKNYLILWKCNLYNIKCKQTFPENHDSQKRDYHFRMEVVFFFKSKFSGQLFTINFEVLPPLENDSPFSVNRDFPGKFVYTWCYTNHTFTE